MQYLFVFGREFNITHVNNTRRVLENYASSLCGFVVSPAPTQLVPAAPADAGAHNPLESSCCICVYFVCCCVLMINSN